jgi:DNA polymerase III alpha subunit|tara:strand:- start:165 stop:686 length:522 start_codon:yes stop_codon:yes gene_type:complete
MATKVKINDYGDCIYSEDAVIEQLYQDPTLDISKITLDTKLYNQALTKLQIDLPKLPEQVLRNQTVLEFDKQNYNTWHMPKSYKNIDVKTYLLDKCNTEEERDRVLIEYKLFEEKGFTKVLKFLIYFVDVLRSNNIVWGVGRGSSVSSFCLFLIGIHKINPLFYNLDYREFLR